MASNHLMDPLILERLRSNDPTLTHLHLSYNQIGDQGAQAIAEALRLNQTLTTLDSLGEQDW